MTVVYQIPDWDTFFENSRSRTYDRCAFVCMPNKQDGIGLTYILAEPDGAMIFGIWCLILQACSRQRRPRAGWLTADGQSTGSPWSLDDLAVRWRRQCADIERALNVISGAKVGWIRRIDRSDCPLPVNCQPTASPLPAQYLEGKGREGKEGKGTPADAGSSPRLQPLIDRGVDIEMDGPGWRRVTEALTADDVAEVIANVSPAPKWPSGFEELRQAWAMRRMREYEKRNRVQQESERRAQDEIDQAKRAELQRRAAARYLERAGAILEAIDTNPELLESFTDQQRVWLGKSRNAFDIGCIGIADAHALEKLIDSMPALRDVDNEVRERQKQPEVNA